MKWFQIQAFFICAVTLEQMTILEKISDDTIVFLQIHKRVWPATQRDALFWSHIREVPDSSDPNAQNIWIVCNHSADQDRKSVV